MQALTVSQVELGFSDEEKETLRKSICPGATDPELKYFGMVCKRLSLDPFAKQIHLVKRKTKNGDVATVQTSIDGFRLIADRTGRYSPGKEPLYHYDENKKLFSATSYIKKQTKDGTWHEVACTAHFSEFCQKKFDGTPQQFWGNMPHVMLSKVAEAQALRKAFPAELSGVYSDDEMDQADRVPKEEQMTELKLEVIDIPPPAKEEKKQLPAEPLTQAQVNWAKNVFKEYGITFDDIQQEWDCCDLENMLQNNLKEFMNNVRAKWGRKSESVTAISA